MPLATFATIVELFNMRIQSGIVMQMQKIRIQIEILFFNKSKNELQNLLVCA